MDYSKDFLEEALKYVEDDLLEHFILTCKNKELPLFLGRILVAEISERLDSMED